MYGDAIPDNQELASQVTTQMLDVCNQKGSSDSPIAKLEIETALSDAGNNRNVLPGKAVPDNWCLPAWSPSTDSVGTLAQPALVDKNYDSTLFLGFFLSRGQTRAFQFLMAASSLSLARIAGRWQLQPNLARISLR